MRLGGRTWCVSVEAKDSSDSLLLLVVLEPLRLEQGLRLIKLWIQSWVTDGDLKCHLSRNKQNTQKAQHICQFF